MQTLPSSKVVAGPASRTTVIGVRDWMEDPRWQLAMRIAASKSLGRSRLMTDFLLYVVDRHIRDRSDEITEQQIGVVVFGRTEGYDSNEDNIVRSYARNLRKRIEEYFSGEGSDEGLRIEIPRGGYIPVFSTRPTEGARTSKEPAPGIHADDDLLTSGTQATLNSVAFQRETPFPHRDQSEGRSLASSDDSAIASRLKERRLPLRRALGLTILCASISLLLLAVLFVPWRRLSIRSYASSDQAASHALWTQIFSNERDTFLVPSDDGLIIMQGLTERPVPLAHYVDGSFRTKLKTDLIPGAPEILKLGGRRYTSVVDLNFVAHLAQLDEVVPAHMMVRYARDLRMEDLRYGNAILIGSVEANPWIELFQPHMNFRFSINAGSDKPSGILNSHPRAGESEIYGTPNPDHTYGLIAYGPNLTSTGHVLIVGGLNTAGTEAATTLLLTPSLMMPILHRARTAHGGFQPFELLIGAANVATNASAPQLVLERIAPP